MEAPGAVAGLTALVVDDDASMRSLLSLALRRLMSTPITRPFSYFEQRPPCSISSFATGICPAYPELMFIGKSEPKDPNCHF